MTFEFDHFEVGNQQWREAVAADERIIAASLADVPEWEPDGPLNSEEE